MDFYAGIAQDYLANSDAEPRDFAAVAVKNRAHAAHNPLAQLRAPQTVDEVLAGRMVVPPLTLAMCSPMTDGAAAAILCSESFAKRHGLKDGVRIVAQEKPMSTWDWAMIFIGPLFIAAALWRLARTAHIPPGR